MKKLRKQILSPLMVLVLVVALSCPALAAGGTSGNTSTGPITIGNIITVITQTSVYDWSHGASTAQAKVDYAAAQAAGDTAGMAAAHSAAEAARAAAGNYSGGADGSQYIPLGGGSSGSSSSSSGGYSGGGYVAPTTYTLTASSGTGGSISPSGSTSVTSGSNQTYTITANSGYKIAAVTVDGSSVGAVSSYTFSSVTSAHTISATFASAASLSAGSATLGDGGSGTLTSGVTKSGYGVTASLPVTSSYVSDTSVTASYNFTAAKTVSLEYVNGTWQFSVNSVSATGARKIYIPVETPDGTYTITFTVKALDPQATALTGSSVYLTTTQSVTVTVKGNMYQDDFTGNS